jgi:hypothetical protein
MKRLIALGFVMFSCIASAKSCPPAQKSSHEDEVFKSVDAYIAEGHCYISQTYGPKATFFTTIEYVSRPEGKVVLTKSSLYNQKGHLLDVFILNHCPNDKCQSDYVAVINDPAAKQREIPTPPTKDCIGF